MLTELALLTATYVLGIEYTRRYSETYKRVGQPYELIQWPLFILLDAARPEPLKE